MAFSMTRLLVCALFWAGWAQAQPSSRWTVFPASGTDQYGIDFSATSIQAYGPYLYLSNQNSSWHRGVWYDSRSQTFSDRAPEVLAVASTSANSDRVLISGSTLFYGQPCFSMDSRARCVISQDLATGSITGFDNGPANMYASRSTANVSALLQIGNDLYVGGWFTQAGPQSALQPTRSIARWDGQQWNALRGGITGSDHPRVTFMGHISGRLIVAGSFEAAGGLPARRMAWFDLQAREWNTFPIEPDGFISQMNVHAPYVYVAGDFALRGLPGGDATNVRLARLDTRTMAWEVMPAIADTSPFRILALHVDDTQVLIGGEFSSVSGVAARNIARWNGVVWEAVGAGTNAPIEALHVQDGYIYAGGNFTEAGGLPIRGAARFNTGSGVWEPLEVVQPRVGLYTGTVLALSPSPGSLVAGGELPVNGPSPARHLVQAFPPDADLIALAGGVGIQGDTSRVRAMVRDGKYLFVGGKFTHAGGQPGFSNLARLDTETGAWHPLGGGVLGEVFALLRDGEHLIVGGSFSRAGTVETRNISRFHLPTETWHAYRDGAFSAVHALAKHNGNLVIGGAFTVVDWQSANRIARWDGSDWQPLGSGLSGTVMALFAHGADLYVGGEFTSAGGSPASRVARWDGQAWHALGQGVSARVRALFVTSEDVFVGGDFTRAGSSSTSSGLETQGIARFNRSSSQWDAMEGGIGPVFALAGWGPNLYVGGSFSGGIARWDAGYLTSSPNETPIAHIQVGAPYPNPSRSPIVHLPFSTTQLGEVRVALFDVLGRKVHEVAPAVYPAGTHAVDIGTERLPAGTYLIRLQSGDGVFTQTWTRLP